MKSALKNSNFNNKTAPLKLYALKGLFRCPFFIIDYFVADMYRLKARR